MNLDEAKELLNSCVRSELRDHAFGDVEVFWDKDDKVVASGYFSGEKSEVYYIDPAYESFGSFSGEDAVALGSCGTEGKIDQNDETGPDEFVVGEIMPGLTKEGVFKELTEQ